MIENLSHIEPSEQLRQDLWEYINQESRSSILSSSDYDGEHDIESNTTEMKLSQTQILYEFPKEIKHRHLNLNFHRTKLSNKLKKLKHSSKNIFYRRATSNESITSMASDYSIETPHQRDALDEKQLQNLFTKIATPAISNASSNISNISTSISTNIKIFDFIPNKSITSQECKDIWINLNPTDTSNDVINATINYSRNNNITLYGNKSEQYQLKYYSEQDDEIMDYLPALNRNDIIASKCIDTIAMIYNINYNEYKIYHLINNVKSECILGIEHDRIHINNHFNYVFKNKNKNDQWINTKILMNNNEFKCEENNNKLEIQSILDISVLNSNKKIFEISFLLECPNEIENENENENSNNPVSIRSSVSSIDLIQIEDYKPDNYNEMWNPTEIIDELKYNNNCYKVRYSMQSETLCYEIVKITKHLIKDECNEM